MGKIYCTECGAELDESVKFCSSCGASLESNEVTHNQNNDFIQSFEIMPIIVYLIVSIVGVYILNSLYLIYPHIIIFIRCPMNEPSIVNSMAPITPLNPVPSWIINSMIKPKITPAINE